MASKLPIKEVRFDEVKQRREKDFVKKAVNTVKENSQPNVDRHVQILRVSLVPTLYRSGSQTLTPYPIWRLASGDLRSVVLFS